MLMLILSQSIAEDSEPASKSMHHKDGDYTACNHGFTSEICNSTQMIKRLLPGIAEQVL